MARQQNQGIVFVFLGVFLMGILAVGLLWWMQKPSDVPAAAPASEARESSARPSGGSPGKTPAFFVEEDVRRFLTEVAPGLVERGLMRFEELKALDEKLAEADRLKRSGQAGAARKLYAELAEQLQGRMQEGASQKEAEKRLAQLRERLEDAERWKPFAATALKAARQLADEGQVALMDGRFAKAIRFLEEAEHQLGEAEQMVDRALEAQLEEAAEQIAALELDRAQALLDAVLAADPSREEIPPLQEQLEALRKELPALRAARQAMEQGQYRRAMEGFAAVRKRLPEVSLVQLWEKEAREAWLEQEVRPLVGRAETHFAKAEYEQALGLLKEALALAPGEKSLEEAIAAVEEKIRDQRIAKLLEAAWMAYEAQSWKRAQELYGKVLDLDPDHPEAREGRASANAYLTSSIRFRTYLDSAREAYQIGDFPRAITAFNRALSNLPEGYRFSAEDEAMRADLERQRERVTVLLRSDEDTWVSIMGVFAPEKFEEKEVELYPGRYSVLGQRTGYREVAFEYIVNANNLPIEIVVEARERAR